MAGTDRPDEEIERIIDSRQKGNLVIDMIRLQYEKEYFLHVFSYP
jgi:hypothetical protein